MKKFLFALIALGLVAVSCKKTVDPQPVTITIQLMNGSEKFAVEGVPVLLSDDPQTYTLSVATDANGVATFVVAPGSYSASVSYTTSKEGQRLVYSGSLPTMLVSEMSELTKSFNMTLNEVATQQIVIKEFYNGGCPKEPSGSYQHDAYIILYNNSEFEADATDIVFGTLSGNSNGTNKYYDDSGVLIFEKAEWIPAYCALWSFGRAVTIPAYSQIVVAIFGAIDHTATYPASVDLSDASYFWMQKNEQFTNGKYVVSDNIPAANYLSCVPFNKGNAWVLSNNSPAIFIGKMPKAQAEALATDTANYDTTIGVGDVNQRVKFPKANVIGCLEAFRSSAISASKVRFSADVNTGYVVFTNEKGYTLYRNVDKEATEALAENKGKLVYDYAGGTTDDEGTTDPSGIDAEASIANGAHIIYKQTGNSGNDFHQRRVASIKK